MAELYVTYHYIGRLGEIYDQGYSSALFDQEEPQNGFEIAELEQDVQEYAKNEHGFESVSTNILFYRQLGGSNGN